MHLHFLFQMSVQRFSVLRLTWRHALPTATGSQHSLTTMERKKIILFSNDAALSHWPLRSVNASLTSTALNTSVPKGQLQNWSKMPPKNLENVVLNMSAYNVSWALIMAFYCNPDCFWKLAKTLVHPIWLARQNIHTWNIKSCMQFICICVSHLKWQFLILCQRKCSIFAFLFIFHSWWVGCHRRWFTRVIISHLLIHMHF